MYLDTTETRSSVVSSSSSDMGLLDRRERRGKEMMGVRAQLITRSEFELVPFRSSLCFQLFPKPPTPFS